MGTQSNYPDFGKVSYRTREGYISKAYVYDVASHHSEGQDKHTDIPIIVKYNEETEEWVQVDDWEWEFDPWGGFTKIEPKPERPPKYIRIQPKRKNRRQRRKK